MEIEKQIADKYLKTYMVEKDPGSASLIAFPTSTEEVVAFIKDANARKQLTITIGRQTGLTSATYPINNAWLLSLEKMNNIISLDKQTLNLTFQACVTLFQISDYLENKTYLYAPETVYYNN